MSFSKWKSVKVMNNLTKVGWIQKKVNYRKPQNIKETKLKRSLRYDINVKIKQLSRLEDPLRVFQKL